MFELLGRCICLALSLAVLGLSIMMTIVPSDYGNLGDFRGGDGMKAPLFTYIFIRGRCFSHSQHRGDTFPAFLLQESHPSPSSRTRPRLRPNYYSWSLPVIVSGDIPDDVSVRTCKGLDMGFDCFGPGGEDAANVLGQLEDMDCYETIIEIINMTLPCPSLVPFLGTCMGVKKVKGKFIVNTYQ
ncbi:hypothetical protein DL98DRAFT_535424 [Cadophora sp. DSE1049]|nr:hypothetical protein DL98DRAFT_535424 [Cadophora sp. DSE1049]